MTKSHSGVEVDDVNGFDNTTVTPLKERLEANGLSIDDLEMVGHEVIKSRNYTLRFQNNLCKRFQKGRSSVCIIVLP